MEYGSSQNCPKMDPSVPHLYRILWVPHEYFTEVTGPAHLHLSSAVLPSSPLSSNFVCQAAWSQTGPAVPEGVIAPQADTPALAQVQLT